MLERISQKLIDILCALPKAIVDWFNLTDASVLFIQYLAVGILVLETLFEIFISSKFFIRNKRFEIGRTFIRNVGKFIPMFIVIILCDPVIKQYMPSDMAEPLNDGSGKTVATALISIIVVFFAINLISLLHELLWFMHAGINLLTKGESKTFRIKDGYGTEYIPNTVATIVFTKLQQIVIQIALLLHAVVLYYNYCV